MKGITRYRALLSNRPYMLLWSGSLISSFGDSLTTFCLAWYVLARSQSPLQVGLTFLVFELPALFSGLLVGWFLDRYRREVVMLIDNLARGCLVILIPLCDALHVLSPVGLYSIVALLGALSVITTTGMRALVTELVSDSAYSAANSLEVVQRQLSAIAGPALAGLLVFLIGPLRLLWIDGATFFCFAGLLLILLRGVAHPHPRHPLRVPLKLRGELLGGLHFTLKQPLLLALLSISFLWNFGLGVFNVALPFYCDRVLHVGPAGMGLLLSLNSLGVLISALIFGPLYPRCPGLIACLLLIAQAICYALMGLLPLFWLVLPLYFLLGALDDLGAIYLATVRQRAVPQDLQGRVLGFSGAVGDSGTPLGSGAGGLLLVGLSASPVVALAGLPLCLIGFLWVCVGPLRRVRGTE